MSKKQSNVRKEFYEQKRLETFSSLKTSPKNWDAIGVHSYVPMSYQVIKVKYPGNVYTEFKPIFNIPDGYKNAFNEDLTQDSDVKCQLCETHLVSNFGILANHEKKLWLKVGVECYDKFKNDDVKALNIKLFKNSKDDFYNNLMNDEKIRIYDLTMENVRKGMKIENSFYKHISRKRHVAQSKTQYTGWLKRNIYTLTQIKYFPDKRLFTAFQYKNFVKKYALALKKDLIAKSEVNKIKNIFELEKICGVESINLKQPFVVNKKYLQLG
jgi:hypothetical protein